MATRRTVQGSAWAALLLIFVTGCGVIEPNTTPAPESDSKERADLRMGYSLLADALGDESRLKMLELFKKITFDGPSAPVGKIVDRINAASEKRSAQLEKLRTLSPDVSGTPPSSSPVGDDIRSVAEKLGQDEMLRREKDFDTRFLVLQAQATRMVAAMAQAIARHDPNEKRVKWLGVVAAEYESIRNELIATLRER